MNRSNLIALIACALCFLILLLPYHGNAAASDTGGDTPPTEAEAETEPPQEDVMSTDVPEAEPFDEAVTLRVKNGGEIRELSLHEYLTGVLAAEMPADFPFDALMAQAIASRTFALRQTETGKHDDADICTDSACCQGWLEECSPEAQVRFELAVSQTDGLVVTYDDKLIDATFFSCSGGSTEAAAAVWGGDIPYLQAVDSPNEEDAPRYSETQSFSAEEFSAVLKDAYPEIKLDGAPAQWFGQITYTAGGGIDTICIGGVSIRGTMLRSLFHLRSTDMTIAAQDDTVQITTRGYGHRVGLSQYGAKAMAENGCSFEEILTHYYQGCAIRQLYLPEA